MKCPRTILANFRFTFSLFTLIVAWLQTCKCKANKLFWLWLYLNSLNLSLPCCWAFQITTNSCFIIETEHDIWERGNNLVFKNICIEIIIPSIWMTIGKNIEQMHMLCLCRYQMNIWSTVSTFLTNQEEPIVVSKERFYLSSIDMRFEEILLFI